MTGFRWPSERGWLVIIMTGLLVYVLTLLAFRPELEKSQLFVAIASGVVGTGFLSVIGMWTSSTKAGAELAQKAIERFPDHSKKSGDN
jgi:hypothetical protein